jgi:sarcosine oxidase
MPHYDAIVIGVGSMGSSTVYHLARRGAKVLGLEQFGIPHPWGSYPGVNRIIRLTYWEHPLYVPLLRRAYELWREIENLSGERLLFITGNVDAGPEDGKIIKGVLDCCQANHLIHEKHDSASLAKRFPGYRFPPDLMAVYQPEGGFILSEQAVVTYAKMAQSFGADIHGHEPVLTWHVTGKQAHVNTSRGEYSADHLVFTSGPWMPKLLPILSKVLTPERQVLIWTQPLRPEHFRLGAFPVFYMEAPEGRFYGLPVYGVPGFKLGKYHHRDQKADPDEMDRNIYPEDEEVLRDAIRRFFPDANGPAMALRTCIFTNTPDEHFIIDRHPSCPQVLLAAGFSGHGFKFSSVIGEIMADLVLEGRTRHDLSLFRLDRFTA